MLSIRTQDRMRLIPYDKPIEIKQTKIDGWSLDIRELKYFLGTYATKERALEVLDEIEQYVVGKIIIQKNVKVLNDSTYQYSSIYRDTTKEEIKLLPQVYSMPKE